MKIRVLFEYSPGDNINLSYELEPMDAEFVADLAHELQKSMNGVRKVLLDHKHD